MVPMVEDAKENWYERAKGMGVAQVERGESPQLGRANVGVT